MQQIKELDPPTQASPTLASPTQAPSTQASPTQAPSTQSSPKQASPTQASPTQALFTQASPTQAPSTQAPPTQDLHRRQDNFFNSPERVPFPEPVDGDVNTEQFLRAVQDYVKFYQKFGVVFTPIVQDALNQLAVLRNVQSEHASESATLRGMLAAEKARAEGTAALELLWLKRALHYYSTLLAGLYDNARLPPEQRMELSFVARQTYEATLSRHHGFFTRNTIKVAYKISPYRATFNKSLCFGADVADEEALYADAMAYRGHLPAVIAAIDAIFDDLHLDTSSRAP